MARKPTGAEAVEQARLDLVSACTVEQLRAAQAVLMPLELGLTLGETARAIGKSPGWVARARIRYIKSVAIEKTSKPRGGRRNALFSPEEEIDFVVKARAQQTWYRSAAGELRKALEKRHGRAIALSTAYKMIARVEKAREADIESLRERELSSLLKTNFQPKSEC